MKTIRRNFLDYLLLVIGIVLLIQAVSSFSRVSAGYCVANPPPGCSWEVVDSFCQKVVSCTTPEGCVCVESASPDPNFGCCYVEIGSIIEGGGCRAQGCTTFKKCCLDECHL